MTTLSPQLSALGIRSGDLVLAHSSFKSLGISDPEEIIAALLETLGPQGTLMMPALTYMQEPHHLHDTRHTPSCVGYLTEYFRTRSGTRRSLHPTHSVCAVGAQAEAMLRDHIEDSTPCGAHSPFRRLTEYGGKILMIGCGLLPMTTMHAVEEFVCPPYLFGGQQEYTITDADDNTFRKTYTRHGFKGFAQRYDRAAELLTSDEIRFGQVGSAQCYLVDAAALKERAVAIMQDNPFYFVDRFVEQSTHCVFPDLRL